MTSPRLATWADRLCLVPLALAVAVELTGGFRIESGSFRLSVTSPWKLAWWTLLLVAVRHLIIRHPSLRERLAARRVARWPSAGSWLDLPLAHTPRREWLVVAVLFVPITAWMLRDQLRVPTGVPDFGDPLFSMWRLHAVAENLLSQPWRLFDGNMFHPMRNTLAFSDATFLPGLIALPFLTAGVPVALVYTSIFVVSFWASGLAMFFLARAVTGQPVAAFLASVIFAFYPVHFSGYGHIEKQGTFFMPIALLLLLRLLQTGAVRYGVLMGAAIAAQVLWSIYIGVFLAIGLAVLTTALWVAGHLRWRDRWRGLLAAVLIVAAVGGTYTLPYWRAREVVGTRPREEVKLFSATPRDLLSITGSNRLYGPYLAASEYPERDLFPGASAVVLSGAALIPSLAPPMGTLVSASAVAIAFAIDAALGVNGITFAALYENAPPFRAFRAPGRFSFVAGLFVALLGGVGFARWFGLASTRRRQLLGLAIVAFAIVELQPVLTLYPVATEPPPIYAALPDGDAAVIVDLPIPPGGYGGTDFLNIYASTFHGRRLVNGVSGFVPPAYARLAEETDRFPGDVALNALRSRGVVFVVLHEVFYGSDRYRNVLQSVELRGDLTFIAARPSPYGGEDRLYRLR